MKYCELCRCIVNENEVKVLDPHGLDEMELCEMCFDECMGTVFHCHICENRVIYADGRRLKGGEIVCSECFDDVRYLERKIDEVHNVIVSNQRRCDHE